mgnify:FL=1
MKVRTKGKNNCNKRTKDLYNFYIKNIDSIKSINGTGKTKGLYNVGTKLYGKIVKDLHMSLMSMIMKDNFEFTLPVRMGDLRVGKKKIPVNLDQDGNLRKGPLQVDWGKTNKLWAVDDEAKKNKVRIFYTNEHTNGYKHNFRWSKKKIRLEHVYYYRFVASRDNKRMLNKVLKDPTLNVNYYELNGHKKIK